MHYMSPLSLSLTNITQQFFFPGMFKVEQLKNEIRQNNVEVDLWHIFLAFYFIWNKPSSIFCCVRAVVPNVFLCRYLRTNVTKMLLRQVSISSTFHVRFFVQNFGAKPNITRKKLLKRRSYKKRGRKTLMKLTSGVNFINILRASICTKVLFCQL